jgi:hypothetical protein
MRTSIVLALVAALVSTACRNPTQSSDDGVVLSVSRSAYMIGDTLRGELINGSHFTVDYNLCIIALDRRTVLGWREIDPAIGIPGSAGCQSILLALESGATVEYRRRLPDNLTPGTYRLRNHVGVGGEGRTLVTQSFEIRC